MSRVRNEYYLEVKVCFNSEKQKLPEDEVCFKSEKQKLPEVEVCVKSEK